MLGQRQQPARDGIARRLRTGAEQQAEEQIQLEIGEGRRLRVVDGGVGDDRQHVVGRLGTLGSDQLLAVGVHARPGLLHRQLRQRRLARAAEVELRLDGTEQPMSFGFGHSQQDADHLHRQFGGDVNQEVERLARHHRVQQPARPGPQIVLDEADHPRRQPGADESPNLSVSRVVHHVEHLARDGQVLQQRATERPLTAGDRREGHRILQHRKSFRVGGDGPEALAVGRVVGGLVPVHRRLSPMDGEELVRKSVGEVVQIGEIDPRQRTGESHRIAPGLYLAASG